MTKKMRRCDRHIILFLDNAGCHPESLQDMFSNIKVVFLPPNTTSRLQPLDAGVIRAFKVRYRKLLLKFVVCRINRGLSAPDITKEVDVLQAIRWIKQAWDEVPEETVRKCFEKCGFSEAVCNSRRSEEEEDQEFEELVRRISLDETIAEQYVAADEEVPSCEPPVDTTQSDWREHLRNEALYLYQKESEVPVSEILVVESDEDDADVDIEPRTSSIKTTAEALGRVDDLTKFAAQLQDEDLVIALRSVAQRLEDYKIANLTQSIITDYFNFNDQMSDLSARK